MLRSTASKVAWVGSTASMVFGLALVGVLIFGAASSALSVPAGSSPSRRGLPEKVSGP